MSGDIKGITVEINGNTTKLDRALKNVQQTSRAVNKELKEVNNSLKFNPGNTELIAQKQRALQKAISESTKSLKDLKQAQEQVNKAVQEGKADQSAYDKITRDIIKVENQIKSYETQLNSLSSAERQAAQASEQRRQKLSDLYNKQEQLQSSAEKLSQKYQLQVAALGNNASATDKLKLEQEQLKQQMTLTAQSIKNLEEALSVAKAEYGANSSQVDRLEHELLEAKIAAEGFKNSYATIGNPLATTTAQMIKAGQSMSNVGRTMTMGVTVPLAGLAIAAGKVGYEFESQMSRVGAIAGATGGDLKELENTAITLGANTAFSAKEAAAGMENLASAGFTSKEIIAAMAGTLDLAATSGGDVALAAEVAASSLRGFGLDASQAGHVADVFAKAAADTNAEVADMGEAMKYVAPVAHGLGLSLEETAAAIGIMSDAGIKGSNAGTALRGSLTRLANPSKEAAKLMQDLGLEFFDAQGKMLPMKDIIQNLNDGMSELTQEERAAAIAEIFGKEAMSGIMALMDAGPGKIDKLTSSFKNANGAAAEMASTMMNNTKGGIEEMFGALESAAIKVAQVMAPFVTAVARAVQSAAEKFAMLPSGVQTFIVALLGIVAAIGPLLFIFGKLAVVVGTVGNAWAVFSSGATAATAASAGLARIFGGISKIFGFIKPAITGVVTALTGLSAPVLVAIAAFTALSIAGMAIYKNWDIIKAKAAELGVAITQKFNEIKTAVSTAFAGTAEKVSMVFQTIGNVITVGLMFIANLFSLGLQILMIPWQLLWQLIGDYVVQAWETIKTAISTALQAISDVISSAWGVIQSIVVPIMDALKVAITAAWDAIKAAIETAITAINATVTAGWNAIQSVVSSVSSAIQGAVSSAWNAISGVVTSVVGTIKSNVLNTFSAIHQAIQSKMDAAKNAVTTAINAIKGAFNFSWKLPHLSLPHITISGSFSLNPPSAPHFGISWYAQGGIFNSPSVIGVGEAGQEAVLPINKLDGILASAMNRVGYAQQSDSVSDNKLDTVISLLSQLVAKDMNLVLDTGQLIAVADRGLANKRDLKGRGR